MPASRSPRPAAPAPSGAPRRRARRRRRRSRRRPPAARRLGDRRRGLGGARRSDAPGRRGRRGDVAVDEAEQPDLELVVARGEVRDAGRVGGDARAELAELRRLGGELPEPARERVDAGGVLVDAGGVRGRSGGGILCAGCRGADAARELAESARELLGARGRRADAVRGPRPDDSESAPSASCPAPSAASPSEPPTVTRLPYSPSRYRVVSSFPNVVAIASPTALPTTPARVAVRVVGADVERGRRRRVARERGDRGREVGGWSGPRRPRRRRVPRRPPRRWRSSSRIRSARRP